MAKKYPHEYQRGWRDGYQAAAKTITREAGGDVSSFTEGFNVGYDIGCKRMADALLEEEK